jgi:hypothetical protein
MAQQIESLIAQHGNPVVRDTTQLTVCNTMTH